MSCSADEKGLGIWSDVSSANEKTALSGLTNQGTALCQASHRMILTGNVPRIAANQITTDKGFNNSQHRTLANKNS